MGYGGVAAVARATGMAISTVRKGRDEARAGARPDDVIKVGCGSFATVLDGRGFDHLTSLSCGRWGGSGLGTSPSA